MITIYLRLRAWWRLRYGFCPQCNSSPPDVNCKICRGDEKYGDKASPTQKWLWLKRYKYFLKNRRK